MPLDDATYIGELDTSIPADSGATGKRYQGAESNREIKTVLTNTLPNLNGAVTATHTELNYVDGVTSSVQTQLDGKADASHTHTVADIDSLTSTAAELNKLDGYTGGDINITWNASGIFAI